MSSYKDNGNWMALEMELISKGTTNSFPLQQKSRHYVHVKDADKHTRVYSSPGISQGDGKLAAYWSILDRREDSDVIAPQLGTDGRNPWISKGSTATPAGLAGSAQHGWNPGIFKEITP